jgi:hypothetical protein
MCSALLVFRRLRSSTTLPPQKDPTRLFLGNFEEVADPCFQSTYIAPGKAGFHVRSLSAACS